MNTRAPLLALLAATGTGAAQGVAVFPSDHRTIPDGAYSIDYFPYSYGVSRTMALYESWDLTIPAGRQITRIYFRADGTTLSYGRVLMLEVRMGRTDRTRATLLPDFDANYLGAPTTVFGLAQFALPDLNNFFNPNPAGPYVVLDLTTPFAFDPTANLLVEWRVLANSNGGAQFSYALDSAAFVSPVVTGPQGCPHSGGQIPELHSMPTPVGGTWVCTLSNAPANQLALQVITLGVPLLQQYPLHYGWSPSCMGQLGLAYGYVLRSAFTGPSGTYTWTLQVPNNRIYNDMILSSQAFCADWFAPGGGVVSNGDQLEIGIDPAMAIVHQQGSATAVTGAVNPYGNVVTFFGYN